jgi:hypothetical protein
MGSCICEGYYREVSGLGSLRWILGFINIQNLIMMLFYLIYSDIHSLIDLYLLKIFFLIIIFYIIHTQTILHRQILICILTHLLN